jgi:HlyD family secretion protein
MTNTRQLQAEASIGRHLGIGILVVALLVGGLGGWAALADISGAVIASGRLVVDSNVKKVQHPTGGIVGDLRVRDGDRVEKGDILLRLDETLTQANLAIARKALDELLARKARLEAERDGNASIEFPPSLMERRQEPDVASRLSREQRAFEIGRLGRAGRKAQLKKRVDQLTESINGYEVRVAAKATEITLIARELKSAHELWEKDLLPISRLTALEREATRIEGERGQLVSLISETKAKISETELQILQIDHDLRTEVGRELREIDAKIGELSERKIAAEDQLRRIEVRAPDTGRVHKLSVHTIGGVVAAGDPILLIVPEDEELTVEVKVSPTDIHQLYPGQPAELRFSALNQRTSAEIEGTVSRISADVATDERTGTSHYSVRIDLPNDTRAALGDLKLIPGMPVDAFIKTRDRKVVSYLLKPITDQMSRAMREDR